MKQVVYSIEGMSCQGCAKAVSNVLNDVVGVQTASVDLADKSAEVSFDEAVINFDIIRSAVAEAGYTISQS